MRGKLEQALTLVHECVQVDRNNPQWDEELLTCIAKAEYYIDRALDRAERTQREAIPLTRITIKSFKAVKQ